jgi:hypothetical protein
MNVRIGIAAASLLGFIGCGAPVDTLEPKSAQSDKKGAAGGKFEAWGAADAPSIFNSALEYRYASLPDNGAATNTPWASSYWPVYEDSINYKWDGASSESVSKKYERAFGLTGVEDAVSKYHGIDNNTGRKECKETSECSDLKDGSNCAKRPGAEKGRCIPTWWGICHAWSPAAILVPEAKYPVTKNGVTFKVNDIKALVTLVHNSTSSKFVSLRCNKEEMREGLPESSTIHYDDYGRPKDADKECRDTNAGTYHLLLTNYLGILKQSFVEDRTFNYEVWNQPLRGYRITEKKEVTASEANRLIGVSSVGGTTDNKTGAVAKDAWQHFGPYTVAPGQSFKVVMTGDGDADLHVAFGGQPTDTSYACRPYGGTSAETCDEIAPADATKAYVSVKGYAATSSFQLAITYGGGAPTTYAFNPLAAKFYKIHTEVDYIGESSSSTDGNLGATIDRYTHTDNYDYILEVDANGKIIGGEWLNSSKKAHPDFLWLPTGVAGSSVAGGKITYAQVKALLDESQNPPGGGGMTGGGTVKTVNESFALAKGAWKQFGVYNVAAGTTLKADTDGDGDADLYVRKGAAPTLTAYDCRPYAGTTKESCAIVGPAQVYVGVNGYATTSNVRLSVVYTEGTGTGGGTNPPPATFTHLNQSGTVATGEMKVFQLPIPAGKKVVLRTTSSVDVDLYIQFGAAPTTDAYIERGYTSTGNETITYTATSNGTLFVGVHGYEGGSFTVKSSD